MASIDERVVAMSFENSKFEAGVAQTINTLGKLNTALGKVGSEGTFSKIEADANKVTLSGPISAIEKLKAAVSKVTAGNVFSEMEADSHKVTFSGVIGAIEKINSKLSFPNAKGAFAELEADSQRVSFAGVHQAIDSLASHFNTLEVAAGAALGNLASTAALAMGRAVSQSLSAIKEGFSDYELKIGATQTIMAGTGEDIHTVSMYLKELDEYADQTIYSLKDMTGNIGKFTNAGVKLDVAVDAMKGISNVAALSGASAEEAARSMYNLGQAIGNGTVALRDWRSVELANMGTKEFKEELIKAAAAMGDLKKNSDGAYVSAKGNIVNFKTFGETLQDDWLSAEALTKTLSKYADESTALGKKAYAAAKDVKTFSMMLETLAAAAGTGWTDTFEIIFGNLPEATKMWTDFTNAIGGVIGKSTEMRNKVLQDWKDLGGRSLLIDGIKTLFTNLGEVLKPVREAFRDIFPRKSGQDLLELTEKFVKFAEALKPTPETADALRRIFAGLFAVLDITKAVVGEVIDVILDLFGVAGEGSGGFMQFLASVGDFLVAIDDAVAKGGALKGIFDGLTNVLRVPLELIKEIAGAIGELFFGMEPQKAEGVASAMEELGDSMKPLKRVADDVSEAWDHFTEILGNLREMVEPGITNLLNFLGGLGEFVAEKFEAINWDRALSAIETGLIGAIFLKLKEALQGGIGIDFGGGLIKNLSEAFGALTDNLKAMQRSIQVATLLEIAAAIVLLAGGVYLLSQIPANKLEKAMSAMAIGLAQLAGVVVLLSRYAEGFARMPFIAGSMILLAGAMILMGVAMKIMASMSWEEIAKGLVGVAGAIAAVAGPLELMNGPKLLVTAAALIPLALAINILAVAVKIFGTMSWEDLGKGLYGVAVALGAVALGVSIMPPNLILTGAGLVVIAAGLILLSGAVSAFGSMDMKNLVQGLLGVSAAIMAIAGAMLLMPPNLPLTAAGLVMVAAALTGIAAVVGILGSMDILTLIKGMAAIGGALVILGYGLTFMAGTLPGSAALLAAAAAFAILGPAIAFMGQLKLTTLLKGLGAMAAIIAVLAVAGALAAAPLTALGIALAALGAGMLVISGALSLFVLALAQLGNKGPKAIAAMVAAFGAFLLVLPKLIIDFVKGLVVILAEIVKLAPAIVDSLVKIVTSLVDGITALSPKVAEAVSALVLLIVTVLSENAPQLIAAGFGLLLGLLTGIRDNLSELMTVATDIVVKFIEGLGANAPRILEAGSQTLAKFFEGIDAKIPDLLPIVSKMITTFLNGVTQHIPAIVRAGANMIVKFLNEVAKAVPRFVEAGTNIILKFMGGVEEAIPRLVKKGLRVAAKFLNGIAEGLVGLANLGFDALIKFLNGLEKSIRDHDDRLIAAGKGVGDAIVDGIKKGIADGEIPIITDIVNLAKSAIDKFKEVIDAKSPSKVFAAIGGMMTDGLVVGIQAGSKDVNNSMAYTAGSAVTTAKDEFGKVSLDGLIDMEPKITPVLDLTEFEKNIPRLAAMTEEDLPHWSLSPTFRQSATLGEAMKDWGMPFDTSGDDRFGMGKEINFYQYNNSPEALSEIEIYRQTKNQMAMARHALGIFNR